MGIYSRTSNSRYYSRFALKLKSFTNTCTMSFKSKLSRRRSALKHKQFHKLATASAIRRRSVARKLYKAHYRVAKARAKHAARSAPVTTRSIPQVRGFLILQVPKTSSGKRKRSQREHVSSASSPIPPHGVARSSHMPAESEASTSRATLDVEPISPRSGGQGAFFRFPTSADLGQTSSSSERCETPEPDDIPHIQPIPVPAPALATTPKPMSSLSLSTRVPYRQPAPPPAKPSSSKTSQPKRRRLANAYKEGVIKSALRRALLAHHSKDKRSPSSSPVGVGLGLVAGVLARARAAMGVASPPSSSPQSPPPVPPSTSSRSIFAAIPTPMPLPAKGTPPSSNTQRGVLRPRKRLQLGPWLVLVERRMKLRQVLATGGKGKQVVPLPKPKSGTGTGLSVPVVGTGAKDVKQVLRREGSTLVAC